ncbi:hypothetical protein [Candidatus Chloroploca asiatica]|uniref:Ig-like domain-containing protein n=1 Tax=Candidatus Chloroploca asiatica TaxID=1506545 RepID=A0A2H3LF10_9CHLR|nr:hypothetical protein [Candidatus Chloroploca asiatica]PDW01407.1 hypothetical protein A9Q02_20915 [Candidatus Chloroploca asiatica]
MAKRLILMVAIVGLILVGLSGNAHAQSDIPLCTHGTATFTIAPANWGSLNTPNTLYLDSSWWMYQVAEQAAYVTPGAPYRMIVNQHTGQHIALDISGTMDTVLGGTTLENIDTFFFGTVLVCRVPQHVTPIPSPSPTPVTPPDDCYLLTSGEGEGEIELTAPSTISVFGGEVWIVQGPVTGPVQTGMVYPPGLYGVDVTLDQGSSGVQVVVCPEVPPPPTGCIDIPSTWNTQYSVWVAYLPSELVNQPYDVTLTGGRAYAWHKGFWMYSSDPPRYPYQTGVYFNANASNQGPNQPFTLHACPVEPISPPTTCQLISSTWNTQYNVWTAYLPTNPTGTVRVLGSRAYAVNGSSGWIDPGGSFLSVAQTGGYFNADSFYQGPNRPFALDYCPADFTPTPTAIVTPTTGATLTPYPTRTPTTTRTPTATGTRTTTPTPIGSAPALSCAIRDSINVPVYPHAVPVDLVAGEEIGVTGPIYALVDAGLEPIESGVYLWFATGRYHLTSLDAPQTFWRCRQSVTPTPTATRTGTPGPTWTPGTVASICIEPATPPPAQTGQLPDLILIIPTLDPLPSFTPSPTGITSSVIISPVQTMLAGVSRPVQTVAAWSDGVFGEGGYALAVEQTEPIVDTVSLSFGWLAILADIGPLAWLLPPLVITVFVYAAKPIISLVRYIKQLIPFN